MTRSYEQDRVQCQALTTAPGMPRCTRIGTHSDGAKVLCERHAQMARAKRANDVLIKRRAT